MNEWNGEFLQSDLWLRLQEATGKTVIPFEEGDFVANGIVHVLPVVGKYLYVPRGPVCRNFQFSIFNFQSKIQKLVEGAKERKMKWIRIEPKTEEMIEEIKKLVPHKVVRAPHDIQPREIFRIDIAKTEEELLVEMKGKTRYNIRLAEKRGVRVFETREERYIATFLDLITATSDRKGIAPHPRNYYQQFFRVLPEHICRLFVAEYEGVVVAANMVIFYGDTVTYLHGGTADLHRDVMAPYLLQWEQIKAAKAGDCHYYDFGGIQTRIENRESRIKNEKTKQKDWGGITKFKLGFSPSTTPTIFPGTYDIVLDSTVYFVYTIMRHIQKLKRLS